MLATALRASGALGCLFLYGGRGDVILWFACVLWSHRVSVLRILDIPYFSFLLKIALGVIPAWVFAKIAYPLVRAEAEEPSKWMGTAKPMLFPCKTTHTRLFPKKHSFQYSYLMAGVPVDWQGATGGMISTSSSKPTWYQIDAADYLERGSGELGLKGKLDAFLKSEGEDPSNYPYAYLITAAKFMGYHFNPVSFWYLYSKDKDMIAMILEVNNTFGERRMYFLKSRNQTQTIIDQGPEAENGSAVKTGGNGILRQAWPKDFHVSPFNSRKGNYSLVAHDLLAPAMEGCKPVDNTITLLSSKGHAKLIARVAEAGPAIDPTDMSPSQKLNFLLNWWWVGFVTFPRIVKEAATLFFTRKLHVWYRPEPLKESISRQADDIEIKLEYVFRKYLRHLVDKCHCPLVVHYTPSGLQDNAPQLMQSYLAHKNASTSPPETIDFKVFTPSFYTRFVHYAHDVEAIFCELNDNYTIHVSRPDLLPKLLFKPPPPPIQAAGYLEYAHFRIIQSLRQRPEKIPRPLTSAAALKVIETHRKEDIRDFRLSPMDGFALEHDDAGLRKMYRAAVLRLFLADTLAGGSTEVLWLEGLVCRVLVAWGLAL